MCIPVILYLRGCEGVYAHTEGTSSLPPEQFCLVFASTVRLSGLQSSICHQQLHTADILQPVRHVYAVVLMQLLLCTMFEV